MILSNQMDVLSLSGGPYPTCWVLPLLMLSAGSLCIYLLILVTYRLIWHPLSRFPGPNLAAVTSAYEFYYDVVLGGKFTDHLAELHERYGPILRINPNEIHISDPDFFDQLYNRTGKQDRPDYFGRRFGYASDTFSSLKHDLHKARRKAICPFFSNRQVSRNQGLIEAKLELLCQKLQGASSDGFDVADTYDTGYVTAEGSNIRQVVPLKISKVVRMDRAWMALTTDIITQYAFGRSYDHLDSPDFEEIVDASLRAIYVIGQTALHCPVIFPILSILPDSLAVKIQPALRTVLGMRKDLAQRIREIRNELPFSKTEASTTDTNTTDHPPPSSIFHQLLASDLFESEKSDARLADEAQLIVGAGLVTTSWALSVATYHIAANEGIANRLRAELSPIMNRGRRPFSSSSSSSSSAILQDVKDGNGNRSGSGNGESSKQRDIPDWHELEILPYLNACVHESIRLSHGLSSRSARVFGGTTPIRYHQWEIPPHTPVSMTAVHICMNKSIFPNPHTFNPDRWLLTTPTDNTATTGLRKYFVPFGKGSRQCLGMNLALAEMYLSIATVFSRFRLELVDTDVSDVEMAHAYLVPYPKWDSRGVRVKVWNLPNNEADGGDGGV